MRRFLATLFLGGMTLAAEAQYPFRTEVNADGGLTVYKTSPEYGQGCPTGALTVPESIGALRVTSIGNGAFLSCEGLTSITIPDSVSSIGSSAFGDCTSLIDVIMGRGVTNISMGTVWIYRPAFGGCTNLMRFTVDENNPVYASVDGVMFDKSRNTLIQFPAGRTGYYGIANGVTRIGSGAFADCTKLTSVTIPDSVTRIEDGAFRGCTGLTTITIPGSVTSMGYSYDSGGAFSDCTGLTNVTMGNGITSIGEWAFRRCTGLTRITIPSSVASVGNGAFRSCSNLIAVCFEGDAPRWLAFPDWELAFSEPATIYYLPGTLGWGRNLGGCPKAPWFRPNPTILDFGDRFGPSTNGFSLVISWATNVPVVVEASADVGAGWTPISTNTLTEGWVQFSDSEWKRQASRCYRVRGQ